MKTIIFDLDGTLCELRTPLESSPVFLSRDMLEACSDIQFAVVTGGTRQEAEFVLARAGVRDLFRDDLVITREDPFGEKKTGEPFREAVRRCGGEVIVIGDSEIDRVGSQRAGLTCLIVQKNSQVSGQEALGQAIREAQRRLSTGI